MRVFVPSIEVTVPVLHQVLFAVPKDMVSLFGTSVRPSVHRRLYHTFVWVRILGEKVVDAGLQVYLAMTTHSLVQVTQIAVAIIRVLKVLFFDIGPPLLRACGVSMSKGGYARCQCNVELDRGDPSSQHRDQPQLQVPLLRGSVSNP